MADTSGIRAGRAFVELGVNDKLDAALRSAQNRVKAFGATMKSVGRDLLKLSAGISAPFAAATVAGSGFEQAMARVKALSGATGEEFANLEREALRMSTTTVFSANDAAGAMAFFAQAGYDTRKIIAALAPTLNLAAAAGMDVAEAAGISTTILSGMGIEAKDLAHAIDLLAKAEVSSVTSLTELGDAMKYVGPVTKTAGFSMEQIVAAIEVLSNAGIKGEMAGTTLRGAILSLADPSEKAITEMRRLGISVKGASGEFLPLENIIGQFERALAGIGSADKLGTIGKIFDARQASGFAKLVERGSAELRKFEANLAGAGGTASRIANVQMNTLQGSFTVLINSAKELGISIEKAIGVPIRAATVGLTRAASAASAWVKENKAIVLAVATAGAAIGALGASVFSLGVALRISGTAIGYMRVPFTVLKVTLAALPALLAAIISPVGIVLGAVVALGAAWAYHAGAMGRSIAWLKDKFGQLGAYVTDTISIMSEALQAGDMQSASEVLWLGLRLAWEEGSAALNRTWLGVKGFMVRTAIQTWTAVKSAAEMGLHGITVGWIETTSFLTSTWQRFTSFIELSWETIKAMAQKAWNSIKGLFSADFNSEAANAAVDMALVAAEQRIEGDKDAALAQIERARQARRDQESRISQGALAQNVADEQTALAGLNADAERQSNATREKLQAARDAFSKAAAAAKAKAAKFKEDQDVSTRPGDSGGLGAAAAEKSLTIGTFNAARIAGLGPASAQERTAKAAEKHLQVAQQQAKHLASMNDKMAKFGTFT